MQLLNFRTRDMFQNVAPASNCQELAGICIEDAVILICIVLFAGGLLMLTLGLNLRARLRSTRQARSDSPPSYSSLGFPPSASRDSLCKAGLDSPNSPPLDPYRVVLPSLDSSLLLKDEYFSHMPYPEPTLAPSRAAASPPLLPSGVGLGFSSNVQTGPTNPADPLAADGSLTPPSPVYVHDPRRAVEEAPVP
ncbi:hypothetical protein FB451DRAFT_1513513 [Mycena latifolia]|nr:hypothetical protein FB451DRAFT_1513513 [Mycena latifolia]